MTPTESPQNRQVPLLQFIIALLLVKSKPSSQSSSDFCKQLVSYIEEGPRSKDSTHADAHINMAVFWRNKCTKLEEENAVLKAKVSRLQARVSELEEREVAWDRMNAEVEDSPRSQTLKRRRDGEPAKDLSGRSAKRARGKVDAVASNERDAIPLNPNIDMSGSDWDELGNNLLDSLWSLQGNSMVRKEIPLGPRDLAHKLCSIANDICHHVSAINLPASLQKLTSPVPLVPTVRSKEHAAIYPQTELEDIVERRLIPIGRMLPHFLFHLHTLSQSSGNGNLCGKVIYRFIDVFRVLFQGICDLAVANAKSNKENSETTKKRDNGREKQRRESSFDERPATSSIIMKICHLFVSMLSHLDPTKSTHKAILEGCFYLLVTRVGEVLKDFTIGARPSRFEEDETTSTNHLNPREGRQLRLTSAANDAEASEAQAPYLMWILKHAKGLISSLCLSANVTTISRDGHQPPKTAQSDSPRNIIYDTARIRLQHTLVRAIFGEKFAASFEPALEPPSFPRAEDLATDLDTQIEMEGVGDSFENEVWRIVGWDVLRGEYDVGLMTL